MSQVRDARCTPAQKDSVLPTRLTDGSMVVRAGPNDFVAEIAEVVCAAPLLQLKVSRSREVLEELATTAPLSCGV